MMDKIIKVIIQYNDKTYIAEGEEAQTWSDRVDMLESLYRSHFGNHPFKWTRIEDTSKEQTK